MSIHPKRTVKTQWLLGGCIFITFSIINWFLCFNPYLFEANFKTNYPLTESFVKTGESIERVYHSSSGRKSNTRPWYEYIPCLFVKPPNQTDSIKACKKEGFRNDKNQASAFLQSAFAGKTSIAVYYNPIENKAFLDGYDPKKEEFLLTMSVIFEILGILGAVIAMWAYGRGIKVS
jgi:hypothetical protein